jgi:tRNA nucleotidyltransferase (CCA-adding enzyme)
MEKINKRLTDRQKHFFNDLSIYINEPIYFYGSIYRTDYIPGKSDIDVDIYILKKANLENHLIK